MNLPGNSVEIIPVDAIVVVVKVPCWITYSKFPGPVACMPSIMGSVKSGFVLTRNIGRLLVLPPVFYRKE
jgi:hypothetical protein